MAAILQWQEWYQREG